MLTGKQRSYLKSLAHNMEPLMQIGKTGVSDGVIKQLDQLLECHELVKVKVLQNSPQEAHEIVDELLDMTHAEFVQLIGSKFTLYRESKENKMIELP